MADSTGPGTELAQRAPLSAELVAQFAQMAMMIPDEDGDAMESIISTILGATSLDQLDEPWETTQAERMASRPFVIDSLKRRPSSYADGLGVFLVVGSTWADTGERFVWTTSAMGVVAQLVRAYAADWLPATAELVIADRPTASGYRPHHLKFTAPIRVGR